ncbi:MAG: C1 family peptidase [Agathobacter sp.]
MKRNHIRRAIAFLLTLILLVSSSNLEPLTVWGEEPSAIEDSDTLENAETVTETETEKEKDVETPSTGYIDTGYVASSVEEAESGTGDIPLVQSTIIPKKYSSVEKGYVTPIRDQRSWGTCWAHAICAAMESYALSHGFVDSPDEVDFSEYALAYLTYKDDLYCDITGDYTVSHDEYVGFKAGANNEFAFRPLSKWAGIFSEKDDTYYSDSLQSGVISEYVVDESKLEYVFTGQRYISMQDTEHVKKAVMENGAVTVSFRYESDYTNDNDIHYYCYKSVGALGLNHMVAIVGWDDTLSKELFSITKDGVTYTPERDGAWLVKNSWGTYAGDEGYTWISYEDGSLSSNAVLYEIAPKTVFDHIYQYDGATTFGNSTLVKKAAEVYSITESNAQNIEAVSFAIKSVNRKYVVNIYKNTEGYNLDQGELVASKSGKTTYEGYYTVFLDSPVVANPGETYTVEVVFEKDTELVNGASGTSRHDGDVIATSYSNPSGMTYYSRSDNYSGKVANIDFCLKMFTTDVHEDTPEIPQINQVNLISESQAMIQWNEIENAESYDLWIGQSATDDNAKVVRVYDNYYVCDVALGDTYYYKVRANYVKDNESIHSEYSLPRAFYAEIELVLNASVSGDTVSLEWDSIDIVDTVSLEWDSIDIVDRYHIYRIEGEESIFLAEIENQEGTILYEDTVRSGEWYTYCVVAYMALEDGTYYESLRGAQEVYVEVPRVDNVKICDDYYKRMIFTWTPLGDCVDGYVIYAYDDESKTNKIGEAEITGGEKEVFEFDTSSFEAGKRIYYIMYAYVIEADGEKLLSIVWNDGDTYGDVKAAPLHAEIKWRMEYVSAYGLCFILSVKEETQENLILTYTYDTVFVTKREIQNSYSEMDIYFPSNRYSELYEDSPMDLYVIDADETTAFQDTPYKIGGEFIAPILEDISDIRLAQDTQTVRLEARITNPMENFDYRYQWYVSDTPDGEAAKIDGATERVYQADVGAYERKYYYCEVLCPYGYSSTTYLTTNESGDRTCVKGALARGEAVIGNISDYTYTGKEIIPSLVITDSEWNSVLVEGTDYSISCENNIDVGTATITILYQGNYSGRVTKTFHILPKEATNLSVSGLGEYTYTGENITPSFVIKDGTKALVENRDYSVTIENNREVGVATVHIVLSGNYTGTITKTFQIVAKSADDLSIDAIDSQKYTGNYITPNVIIKHNDIVLQENVDYTVQYQNNKEVGTAKIVISFYGNYSGNRTVSFEIFNPVPENVTSQKVFISETKNMISQITAGETVSQLLAKINERDYVKIYKNGIAVSASEVIGTGMILCIMDGNTIVKEYVIVVTGDTNGDGKINITDMVAVKAHILKKTVLSGVQELACDVNGDGKVNITDFIKIKATLLKKDSITGIAIK